MSVLIRRLVYGHSRRRLTREEEVIEKDRKTENEREERGSEKKERKKEADEGEGVTCGVVGVEERKDDALRCTYIWRGYMYTG
ncbi:hypothetical protein CSUI_007584 [Cystoisospora suis]|uniref:Uncharacterized protein n=1 Tax=Cystoisospora suis TaxID=483139 RepID=A0A2C6KM37_9APIC|nr:hypothetical protein CSUI_007584 [Cystoisospora suis]